jgi:hypothetical protein
MNGGKGRATIKVRGFSYSLLDKNGCLLQVYEEEAR